MKPIETTQLDLQFALGASPWWLLALIPLAALLGWALYRGQGHRVTRFHFWGVCALRMVLLALLAFLLFRPSVLYRQILRFPGRILMLVDDSASMDAADTALSDTAALRLARSLGRIAPDDAAQAAGVAEHMEAMAAALWAWYADLPTAKEAAHAYPEKATALQELFFAEMDGIEKLLAQISLPPEAAATAAADATGRLSAIRQQAAALLSAEKAPTQSDCAALGRLLASAQDFFLGVQDRVDAEGIAKGNAALTTAAEAMRHAPRRQLMAEILQRHREGIAARCGDQWLQTVRLSDGAEAMLADFGAGWIPASEGPTRIMDQIKAIADAKNDFPLSSVVVLSDGRQFGGVEPKAVLSTLAQRQVPVHAALAGAEEEPRDVSVLEVACPPFAVKGAPVTVRARIKTSLPKPVAARIEIREGTRSLAAVDRELGRAAEEVVELSFTPDAEGYRQYVLQVSAVEGEIFPSRNNAAAFVTNVRAERLRVLLLDWRPRWETQLVMNAFRRMDWIEFNPIVLLAAEGAELRRGAGDGRWPDSAATLAAYDLVILGDVPSQTLTRPEWKSLSDFVTVQGRTLCLLSPDRLRKDAAMAEWMAALSPIRAREIARPAAFSLTSAGLAAFPSGAAHALTGTLAAGLGRKAAPEPAAYAADSQPLIAFADDGIPCIAARLAGKGKVLDVATDQLWRALNADRLQSHRDLYVQLVAWAIDGGWCPAETPSAAPVMAVDRRVVKTGDVCQVWLRAGSPATVTVTKPDGTVVSADAVPCMAGGLLRLEGQGLPAGAVRIVATGSAPVTLQVIDDNPELRRLAADRPFVQSLADGTGGTVRSLADMTRLFVDPPHKDRVEKNEYVWRLWDSGLVLAILVLMITGEWIWRKLAGLI